METLEEYRRENLNLKRELERMQVYYRETLTEAAKIVGPES